MPEYKIRPAIPDTVGENLKSYSELLQKLLFYRGIETADKADEFLNPSYEKGLHNPYLMKDMAKAVERILVAIKNNEKIVIFSDYDADGIPAAVALSDFFKKIQYQNVEVYIPHRHTEGYGLNREAIQKFGNEDTRLIVTLDCGISDRDEVEYANGLGIDVIVTDHHIPVLGELPPAYAILNSKQSDCSYPYSMLCGAGVAFKLVQAILEKNRFGLKEGSEKWLLDMVGLATLSDMVPLQGENRIFARYGLQVLRKSPRPGLQKLLRAANVEQKFLSEDDIGFMVTPRINAASRMSEPIEAYRLLSTDDEALAGQLAKHLDSINAERKILVAQIAKEIKKGLSQKSPEDMPAVFVLGNPLWRPAVLGLVANSLVTEYGRPAFVWGREDGGGIKGSCRSDGSVDLVALMGDTKDLFSQYGGHVLSGGFAVAEGKIHVLPERISEAYLRLKKENAASEIAVDSRLSLDDVNPQTYGMLEQLAPFGTGNPKPLFIFSNIRLEGVRHFGKENNHLELSFKNSKNDIIRAIGFFQKSDDFGIPLKQSDTLNLVATIEKSFFRNRPELRLRLVDIF